jgi:hypothetical protein
MTGLESPMYKVNNQKLTEVALHYGLDLVIVLWRNSAASAPRRRSRPAPGAILTWPCVGSGAIGKTWEASIVISLQRLEAKIGEEGKCKSARL